MSYTQTLLTSFADSWTRIRLIRTMYISTFTTFLTFWLTTGLERLFIFIRDTIALDGVHGGTFTEVGLYGQRQ